MGKIKIKNLGDETLENEQKQQSKQKNKEKKFVKGGKGGEKIVAVGPSEEELAKIGLPKETEKEEIKVKAKTKKLKKTKKNLHSKSYQVLFFLQ